MDVQVPLRRLYNQSGTAGSLGSSIFRFVRTLQTDFPSNCISLHIQQQSINGLLLPHPHFQHLWSKAHGWDVTGPNVEPAIVIFLTHHAVILSSKYSCLHPQTRAALSLGQRSSLLAVNAEKQRIRYWVLSPKRTSTSAPQPHCHSPHRGPGNTDEKEVGRMEEDCFFLSQQPSANSSQARAGTSGLPSLCRVFVWLGHR